MVRTIRLAKESTKSLIDWECFESNKVSIWGQRREKDEGLKSGRIIVFRLLTQ